MTASFDATVVPLFKSAIKVAEQMQTKFLQPSATGETIATALTKHAPALSEFLTKAESKTHELLRDTETRVAAALLLQKQLVETEAKVTMDLQNAESRFKVCQHQIQEQQTRIAETVDERNKAERARAEADAEYERLVKKKRDLETAMWATIWIPFVGLGCAIGAEVTRNDVNNAAALYNEISNRLRNQQERLDTMRSELQTLENQMRDSHNKKQTATDRLAENTKAMDQLKRRRKQLADLDLFLKDKSRLIGLAAGSARILEHKSGGFVMLGPAFRILDEMVKHTIATGLVSGPTAARLSADMESISARANEARRLPDRDVLALDSFFA
ncbi:hypothetical protein GGF31_008562 [Allomyces arbusculus]|nr:hypothetical protein GGF31_008562 [Allomyces arbusculus]